MPHAVDALDELNDKELSNIGDYIWHMILKLELFLTALKMTERLILAKIGNVRSRILSIWL